MPHIPHEYAMALPARSRVHASPLAGRDRYAFSHSVDDMRVLLFDLAIAEELAPRYNVAPTQRARAIRENGEGRELVSLRWGLVPHWANPQGFNANLFNARSETAWQKPSFRDAVMRRSRCVVPANLFYEWKTENGKRQPYAIRQWDGRSLALRGLWSRNERGPEQVESFTILTTAPNAMMSELHDRQPLILDYEDIDRCLDPGVEDVEDLLRPSNPDELEAYPVSTAVGNVRNNSPELVEPLSRSGQPVPSQST
jgi:putative SOS response-associated peptidase YedK